jgi:D-sedoheptulose 7-phosphate isomerase
VGFVLSGVYGLAAAVGADCDEAAYLACGAASAAAACPGPKRVGIDDLLKIAYREIEAQLADGLEVFGRIARDGLAVIDRAARSLMQAYADGRQVLVFGNGGSAAEANHLAGELTGRFKQSRPGLPAISLSANDSITTCIANDYAYDEIFARQIETFGREGDVAIGLSTSGRSPNVVQGLKRAKERGMRTIAFTGAEPGPAGEYADVVVAVPSRSTARIQEAHLFIIHVMCDMLDRRLDAAGRLNPAASRI